LERLDDVVRLIAHPAKRDIKSVVLRIYSIAPVDANAKPM